jgi:transposase
MDENLPPEISEISSEEWQQTPESVKRLVMQLLEQMGQVGRLVERIEQLERQYEEVKSENQLLKEQLQLDSKNSSKPPSQDRGKGFKSKEKSLGKKQRGGQPGHEGHERRLYPIEQCQVVEEHYPETCIECGAA